MKSDIMQKLDNGREAEQPKFASWLESLMRLPLGHTVEPTYARSQLRTSTAAAAAYLDGAKDTLDAAVYGHEPAKHKLLQFIAQRMQNAASSGSCFLRTASASVSESHCVRAADVDSRRVALIAAAILR